ncbi:hypothetical protein FRC14_003707 [Serendipita sp. 396]|nr:hypothetical protein FRC14_003707 [Serendipita sp. 396]KAG8783340.1 hypothetical protein FRC15_005351 [Serendipita sp. 397]
MADIQGQAAHTLKITNLEEDGRSELVINRAMVIYGVNSQDFDSDDPTSLASTENGSSDQRIVIIISLSIVLPAMLLLCLCTFLGTRNRRGGGFLWCNFWIPRVRPKSKHSIRLDKELDHLPAPLSGLYHLDKTSNSRPTLHLVLPTGVMMGGTTPSISPVPLTGATTASTDSAGDERLLERIRIKYGYMGKSPARAVGPGLLVPSIQETHQFPVPASPAIPWTVHVPQPPHRFQPYSRPPGRSRSMHTSVEAYDRREKRRRPQARLSLPPPPAYEQAVASSVSPVSEESLAMTIPQ